jgi:hypothetical protein
MMGPVCWSLTLPLLLGATQDDWKVFTPKDGGFTVKMPSTPTETKKKVTGQLDAIIAVAEGRNDSYFVVSYCDIPAADLKKGTEQKRLDQACKGAKDSSGGDKLRSEKPITIDGHPGREIFIEKNGEVIARMRIYLVSNRLYQVMVLGNGRVFSAKDNDVGSFLDSFRLNK